MEQITNTQNPEHSVKSWSYSEKAAKHTIYHTISVSKERFTHEQQIKEASQAMRKRTDVSLKNVNSVSSSFGLQRNIKATVILAVLAALAFFIGLIQLFDSTGFGIVLIISAVILGALAFLIYRKVKLTFMLEIETVHTGNLKQSGLSYGNTEIDFGKSKHSLLFYLALIVIFPLGIIYLITTTKSNNIYKFEMDAEIGNEIVDTVGAMLIEA